MRNGKTHSLIYNKNFFENIYGPIVGEKLLDVRFHKNEQR